jgi:hypothetical protein
MFLLLNSAHWYLLWKKEKPGGMSSHSLLCFLKAINEEVTMNVEARKPYWCFSITTKEPENTNTNCPRS